MAGGGSSACRTRGGCRSRRRRHDGSLDETGVAVDELLDVERLLAPGRPDRIRVAVESAGRYGIERVRAAAAASCSGDDAVRQRAGLLVLGALGIDDDAARDELVEAATRLGGSGDAQVRTDLAEALGLCSTDGRTTTPLLELARDADPMVRLAAVQGLSISAEDEPEDGGEVAALLLLKMDDTEPDIRDWATFALGVQRDIDSPQLRDALMRRLADEDSDADGEAAVALARRGDLRVLPVLLAQLDDLVVGNLWVEAAAELAHPSALPALLRLRDAGWGADDPRPEVLDEAISRCSG